MQTLSNTSASRRRLDLIYRLIEKHPSSTPGYIARLAGMNPKSVNSLLLSLERNGYLLSEDAEGGLYPFEARAGD